MKTSFRVSLGGVVGALGLVLMLLTSIIPFGTYAFPAFAGIFLICIVIELGYGWAFLVYFVTAVMSMLLVADKEAALMYALFLGYYPIIKGLIEKTKHKVVQFVLKLSIFNLCMVAVFYVSIFVLAVPKDSFNLFGVYLPWIFLILGNFVFIIYDYCVSRIVTIYINRLRNLLINKTKL